MYPGVQKYKQECQPFPMLLSILWSHLYPWPDLVGAASAPRPTEKYVTASHTHFTYCCSCQQLLPQAGSYDSLRLNTRGHLVESRIGRPGGGQEGQILLSSSLTLKFKIKKFLGRGFHAPRSQPFPEMLKQISPNVLSHTFLFTPLYKRHKCWCNWQK